MSSIYIKLLAKRKKTDSLGRTNCIIGHHRPSVKRGLWKCTYSPCYNPPMSDFGLLAGLVILFVVNLLLVIILERQSRKNNELIAFLVEQFRGISVTQDNTHLQQIDSLISMNGGQADRHQKQVDSFLGLIDELAARANPDKITSRQFKSYENYLKSQVDE